MLVVESAEDKEDEAVEQTDEVIEGTRMSCRKN